MEEKHRRMLGVYSRMHEHRKEWFSPGLRLAMIVVALIVLSLVYAYFNSIYNVAIESSSMQLVTVSSLMFDAFIAGAVFGVFIFVIVVEGEYFLGIRKRVNDSIEEEEAALKVPAAKGRRK